MDPKDETDRTVNKVLQKIVDDDPIDSEEKKQLLMYIRVANSERKH